MKPRPYQYTIIEKVEKSLLSGGSPFVVAPTGSGKMVIIAAVAGLFDGNILIVEHRDELIDQAIEKLNIFGITPGLVVSKRPDPNLLSSGRITLDFNAKIKVSMIQTVNRRDLGDWKPDLIIIDEAHLSAARSYVDLVARFGVQIVGFSASPTRLDGKGFDHIFTELILGPSIAKLTEMGHLVPVDYVEFDVADFSKLNKIGGDYDQDEVGRILEEFSEDIVDTWKETCSDRPTVLFSSNVNQSKSLTTWFQKKGITAEHIDGKTPPGVRAAVINRFKSGKTRVLCNCGIVIEGFDAPLASCVILAMSTLSLAKFLQCCGRGMRPDSESGKVNLVIFDFGNNHLTHGYPDQDRTWTLAPKQMNKRETSIEHIEYGDDEQEESKRDDVKYEAGKYDYGIEESETDAVRPARRVQHWQSGGLVVGAMPPPKFLPKQWITWWFDVERYRISRRLPVGYSENLARDHMNKMLKKA